MVTWERITRDSSDGKKENGLKRTLTIEDRFNEDAFTDTEAVEEVREFWQSDFDNELEAINEQIAILTDRKAKVQARKAKLVAKWQSLG